MIKESLFIEPVSDQSIISGLEKKAANTLRLAPEANWEQEIIKYIYENVPYVTKYPFQVDIDKRSDRQKGVGFGQIIVKGTVVMPVIINGKDEYAEMKPLDVFRANGKTYPLSKSKVDEILYSPEIGRVVDTKKMVQSVGNDMASNQMSNTTPPTVQGPGPGYTKVSALELILPSSTSKSREALISRLVEPATYTKMASNGTVSVLEKVAIFKNSTPKSTPEYTEIRKIASGYRAIVHNTDMSENSVDLDAFAARKTFGDEPIIKAASAGISFVDHVKRDSPVYIKEDMYVGHDLIEKTGSYIAHTKGGDRITGRAMNEIGFDGEPTGNKLFTDGCKFASSNKIKGIEVMANTGLVMAKTASFDSSKYKSFALDDFSATIPLKFTNAVIKQANGVEIMTEPNIHGITSVEVTSDIKGIYKMGSKLHVSPDARFIEVGHKVEMAFEEDSLSKIAQLESFGDPEVKITKSVKGYLFKYANKMIDMDRLDAISAIVKLGSNESESHTSLGKADKSSITLGIKTNTIGQPKALKPQLVDPSSKQPTVSSIRSHGMDKNSMRKFSMWLKDTEATREKLASIIPDETSVDAILSLGLVNDQSINVFRDAIPMMEECVSRLASMLLAIRYGFKRVPETAVLSAMEYLGKVTESLKDVFKIEDMSQNISSEQGA